MTSSRRFEECLTWYSLACLACLACLEGLAGLAGLAYLVVWQ